MVGLRMDQEASHAQFYHIGTEQASATEIVSQDVSGDEETQSKEVDDHACLESKLVHTSALNTNDDVNGVDMYGTRGEALRISERSEEEEVVDVSPSGCTLSSLGLAKQELASKVKNMFVFDNTFTVLPPSIHRFKNLRRLKFFSNEVRTLPQELEDLTQLEHLYLKFSPTGLGSLPSLGKLTSLKALELHQVPARPSASSLSREIAQLHSLTRLSVCHFSISWVPVEIGNLKKLEELDLSFNKLKALPKEISGLLALRSLRVASNKLVELPAELTNLPSLTSIDVSHNRLMSLSSLQLVSMPSLRLLNAQFNKLQHVGSIPEWISCKLEGNERLQSWTDNGDEQTVNCVEDDLLDWEPPGSVDFVDDIEGGGAPSACAPAGKGTSPSKSHSTSRGRRGWRKQDSQQQKARQDRLNSSRKCRLEGNGEVNETDSILEVGNAFQIHQGDGFTEQISCGQSKIECVSLRAQITQRVSLHPYCAAKLEHRDEGNGEKIVQQTVASIQSRNGLQTNEVPQACNNSSRADTLQEVNLEECQDDDVKESKVDSVISSVSVTGLKAGRRQESDGDGNPKPSKRRRSIREYSEVSLKYRIDSFVGFDDRLHDGFYDAGRDRPFLPLDVLAKEQPCFDSREVILVDREKDEELDVMALSAQQLLAGLGSSKDGYQKGNMYQRMAVLALFVSDCFGGSDKTNSISHMRRSALGGTAGMPFVCSCSTTSLEVKKLSENSTSGVVLPSVHMLCQGAVRFLKAQQGSNILPIGSFAYGVCRHRAILFKYLCDRADPVIPCELVRGYLDYMPHAWNVVLVEDASGSTRMLVDACRPLDIRQEQDPEYFCRGLRSCSGLTVRSQWVPIDCAESWLAEVTGRWRCFFSEPVATMYIPFKRIHLPLTGSGEQEKLSSYHPAPVLHEDIGNGASGAIVQKCTFGSFEAAAKVRGLEALPEEGSSRKALENSCLSELRILCSLQHHPCIVAFYGHHLSTGLTFSPDSADVAPQSPQLIIFMEYVKGGSLEGYLQGLVEKDQAYVPPKIAMHVARDVACALTLLHSKSIIHRDIKSSNVLIDLDAKQELGSTGPVVKLCDFDRAVPLQSSSTHTCYMAHRGVPSADVCVGTPRWIAPEVLRAMYGRHTYGMEADIWSFGCLLLELLTLKVPYDGLTESEVHSRIQIGQRPQLPPEFEKLRSPSTGANDPATCVDDPTEILTILVRLFYSCTDPNPSKRPTAKEVFSALGAAVADRACTISSVDGQVEQKVETLVASKVDEISSGGAEVVCHVCSSAKTCSSCSGGNNPDESISKEQ